MINFASAIGLDVNGAVSRCVIFVLSRSAA